MSNFSEKQIQEVWEKGKIISNYDKNKHRKDACNAWMTRSEYGNQDNIYGWEIDHIKPVSKEGTDNLRNLQPLQWENNRHKADNYPNYDCAITANDNKNVKK